MGVVLRARDRELGRAVAIKMIREVDGLGADELQRFQREAQANARLRHPNIVALHEVGNHGGRPYLVMDLIDGRPLHHAIDEDKPTPRRVAAMIREVALALEHAHAQGIIHRDVKPANVLVDREGHCHLMDFGLARSSMAGEQLTMSGQLVGTPGYMAPEQAGGEREQQGPPTDVWAIGAVLYRALCGRPPFEGQDLAPMMKKILFDDPPAPRDLVPTVHPDLETIALRCLEKEPEARYPTAKAVARELKRFLDGEAIEARPIGRREKARRWVRRNRLAAGALGLLASLALVAAVAFPLALRDAARRAAAAEANRAEVARAQATGAARVALAKAESRLLELERTESGTPEERLDAIVAAGLELLQRAQTVVTLARPGEERQKARSELATHALAFGELALAQGQWGVSASAFELADAPDKLIEVKERHAAELRGHAQLITNELDRARQDPLFDRSSHDDVVFAILEFRESQTIDLVARALDEVASALRDVIAAAYCGVTERTDFERRADSEPVHVEGLDPKSVREWMDAKERDVSAVTPRAIVDARSHLLARAAGLRRWSSDRDTREYRHILQFVLSDRQDREIPTGMFQVAGVCLKVLQRFRDVGPEALRVIRRYVLWDRDADRVALAAATLAICAPNSAEVETFLRQSWPPKSSSGPIWRRVCSILELSLPTLERSKVAVELERLAKARASVNRLDEAIASLDDAIQVSPYDAQLWGLRGLYLGRLERLGAALADHSRATHLTPGDAIAWLRRGRILQKLGRLREAIDDYSRGLALAPLNADGWRYRGETRWKLEDLEGALHDLTRATHHRDDYIEAWMIRGRVEAELLRSAEATQSFTRAIELRPQIADPWFRRGLALLYQDQDEQSLADLGRAIELEPDNADFLWARSRAHARLGLESLEKADLRRFLEVAPPEHLNRKKAELFLDRFGG